MCRASSLCSHSRDITFLTKVCIVTALGFLVVMYGMWELDHKEGWVLKNWCFWTVVPEKSLECPLICKEIKPVNLKGNQPWIFIRGTDIHQNIRIFIRSSNTLATWWEELTHWKRPWSWGRLKAGGERDNRGWDGWMASPTQWTWVWASSGR